MAERCTVALPFLLIFSVFFKFKPNWNKSTAILDFPRQFLVAETFDIFDFHIRKI